MLPFLSLILAAAVHTDTLVVEEAKIEGPHPIPAVHMTDSVNLEGKRYDITDILKQNTSLALRPFKTDAGVIRNGDAVGKPSSSDSIATLSVLQVTVDAVRWTKCRLISEQMKQHKYFLDGKETDGEMRLLPGRHEIKIIDFVDATAAPDTFDLRITGNDLSHLNVNPTTPRNFDLDLNVHGPRYGGISISPSGRYAATQYLNVLEGGENIWHTTLTDLKTGRTVYAGEYRNFKWCQQRDAVYYTRKGVDGLELIALDVATMSETVLAAALPDANFRLSPDESFVIISRNTKECAQEPVYPG